MLWMFIKASPFISLLCFVDRNYVEKSHTFYYIPLTKGWLHKTHKNLWVGSLKTTILFFALPYIYFFYFNMTDCMVMWYALWAVVLINYWSWTWTQPAAVPWSPVGGVGKDVLFLNSKRRYKTCKHTQKCKQIFFQ